MNEGKPEKLREKNSVGCGFRGEKERKVLKSIKISESVGTAFKFTEKRKHLYEGTTLFF